MDTYALSSCARDTDRTFLCFFLHRSTRARRVTQRFVRFILVFLSSTRGKKPPFTRERADPARAENAAWQGCMAPAARPLQLWVTPPKGAGGQGELLVMSPSPPYPAVVPSPAPVCTPHSGHPALLRMKYWSCCGIKTTDFSAFMEQPGCSRGCHCWTEKKVRGLSAEATHVSNWHYWHLRVFLPLLCIHTGFCI